MGRRRDGKRNEDGAHLGGQRLGVTRANAEHSRYADGGGALAVGCAPEVSDDDGVKDGVVGGSAARQGLGVALADGAAPLQQQQRVGHGQHDALAALGRHVQLVLPLLALPHVGELARLNDQPPQAHGALQPLLKHGQRRAVPAQQRGRVAVAVAHSGQKVGVRGHAKAALEHLFGNALHLAQLARPHAQHPRLARPQLHRRPLVPEDHPHRQLRNGRHRVVHRRPRLEDPQHAAVHLHEAPPPHCPRLPPLGHHDPSGQLRDQSALSCCAHLAHLVVVGAKGPVAAVTPPTRHAKLGRCGRRQTRRR